MAGWSLAVPVIHSLPSLSTQALILKDVTIHFLSALSMFIVTATLGCGGGCQTAHLQLIMSSLRVVCSHPGLWSMGTDRFRLSTREGGPKQTWRMYPEEEVFGRRHKKNHFDIKKTSISCFTLFSLISKQCVLLCAVGWCLLRSMNTPQRKIYIYSLIYRHNTLVCNMKQCSY